VDRSCSSDDLLAAEFREPRHDPVALAIGDINEDGRPDVITAFELLQRSFKSQLGEQLFDFLQTRRLNQVLHETRLQGAFAVTRRCKPGHCNQNCIGHGSLQAPSNFVAVHPREPNIAKDYVRVHGFCDGDSLVAIATHIDMVPHQLEHVTQAAAGIRVVVHQQHTAFPTIASVVRWPAQFRRITLRMNANRVQRETHRKGGARTRTVTTYRNIATVQLDQPFDEGKPEPQPTPALRGTLALHEWFE
jgi:hypothetical protein